MNIEDLTIEEWNYSARGLFYYFEAGLIIYTYKFIDNYMNDPDMPIIININKWRVVKTEENLYYSSIYKVVFENTETGSIVQEEYPSGIMNRFRENKLISINNEPVFFDNRGMYHDIIMNLFRFRNSIIKDIEECNKLLKNDIIKMNFRGTSDALQKRKSDDKELSRIEKIINKVYSLENKVNGKISI